MDLKCKLGAVENERRLFTRAHIGREQCDGFRGHTLSVPDKISICDVLPAARALIPERVRMGTNLHFRFADRRCRDRAAALINDLFNERAFGVRKELMIPNRDRIGLGNLDSRVPANNFIRAEKQIELLF